MLRERARLCTRHIIQVLRSTSCMRMLRAEVFLVGIFWGEQVRVEEINCRNIATPKENCGIILSAGYLFVTTTNEPGSTQQSTTLACVVADAKKSPPSLTVYYSLEHIRSYIGHLHHQSIYGVSIWPCPKPAPDACQTNLNPYRI